MADALLEIADLVVSFRRAGGRDLFRAVDGVSLELREGEILGLVGESGSGKTTLGKALLRLHEPASGSIRFRGLDITHLGERRLRRHRRELQMVFQDPLSSLNPRQTIAESLAVPLRLHRLHPRAEIPAAVDRLLRRVGLSPTMRDRFPHEVSGGQLQRVAIGRALTMSPSLIVADEAVSKLDVSVRAQILNLFKDIRAAEKLAILFITHDLHVARYLCDRIGVMFFGKLVELAPTAELFAAPRHPYTRALLATLADELGDDAPRANPEAAPTLAGCRYAARCEWRAARCAESHPAIETTGAHSVACYEWQRIADAPTRREGVEMRA
jgi:oligopeptide/dipeptide ABC transporter ATP-binding protein